MFSSPVKWGVFSMENFPAGTLYLRRSGAGLELHKAERLIELIIDLISDWIGS